MVTANATISCDSNEWIHNLLLNFEDNLNNLEQFLQTKVCFDRFLFMLWPQVVIFEICIYGGDGDLQYHAISNSKIFEYARYCRFSSHIHSLLPCVCDSKARISVPERVQTMANKTTVTGITLHKRRKIRDQLLIICVYLLYARRQLPK